MAIIKKRVYLDANTLIDLVRFKVKAVTSDPTRADDVWYVEQLLEAARASEIDVFTSSMSIVECVSVKDPNKEAEAQDFFIGLLESGKSGIKLIQPTSAIQLKARDLRWRFGLTLKGLDSVHAATALFFKCDEFLTHDGADFGKNEVKLAAMGLVVCAPSKTSALPAKRMQLVLPIGGDASSA